MASDGLFLRWGRKKKLIYTKYPGDLGDKNGAVGGTECKNRDLERSGSCVIPNEADLNGSDHKSGASDGKRKVEESGNFGADPAGLNCSSNGNLEPAAAAARQNGNAEMEFLTNGDASSSQNSKTGNEEEKSLQRNEGNLMYEESVGHKRSAAQALPPVEGSDYKRRAANLTSKNLGPTMCRERRLLQQHLLPDAMKIPKLHIALSYAEKAKDFASFGQAKFSNRPTIRRSKAVEHRIQQITPGMFLSEVCFERYAVKEKPQKKKASGLKSLAMNDSFRKKL